MKTLKLLFFILSATVFTTVACNHVSKSGEVGDQFYSYLQQKKYDAIISLMDKDALAKYSAEEWKDLFATRNEYLGQLVSYKPVGFHTETTDEHKIIKLNYQVNNTNGLVYEEIELVSRGNQIKILNYNFSADVAMADK